MKPQNKVWAVVPLVLLILSLPAGADGGRGGSSPGSRGGSASGGGSGGGTLPASTGADIVVKHAQASYEYRSYVSANPNSTAADRQAKYNELFAESNKLTEKSLRAQGKAYYAAFMEGAAVPYKKLEKLDGKASEELAKKTSQMLKNAKLAGKGGKGNSPGTTVGRTGVSDRNKTNNARNSETPVGRNHAATPPPKVGGADAVSFGTSDSDADLDYASVESPKGVAQANAKPGTPAPASPSVTAP
ncbi:MAG: hypothetical protein HY074_19065, partial [Deltaproteobacteria bacterium]|nr:hypothetical protein [Deltaproteobacteria bacterium]